MEPPEKITRDVVIPPMSGQNELPGNEELSETVRSPQVRTELEMILSQTTDALVVYDPSLRYTYINDSGALFFGIEPENVIGKTNRQLLGTGAETIDPHVLKAFATGEKVFVLHEIPVPEGTRLFDTVYSPVHDESGQVSRVVGICRDVTQDKLRTKKLEAMVEHNTRDLKKANKLLQKEIREREILERALRASESQYRLLYENTPAILHSLDCNSRIISVSDQWIEILGYERSEVLGQPITDFMTDEARSRALEGHVPPFFGTSHDQTLTAQLVKKNGQVIDVMLRSTAERSVDGEVIGSLAAAVDITEMKRAESAILKAKEEWERTFDAVPDLVMILDKDRKIRSVNRATVARLGITKGELIGSHCFQIVHGTDIPPSFCPCAKISTDEEEHAIELSEPRLGGTFRVTFTPIRDAAGEVIAFVHVARDITEYKQIEEKLAFKVEELKRANEISRALVRCSKALLECHDFQSSAQRIFDAAKEVIRATAGYLALLSADGTRLHVLHFDPGKLPCTIALSRLMPVKGLRAQALREGDIVCRNDLRTNEGSTLVPGSDVALSNVMLTPLLLSGKAVGLLGLANKPGGFGDNDFRYGKEFAEFAVIGLVKSRTEEALRESETKFRQLAENIEEAFWLSVPNDLERKAYVSPAYERLWGWSAETFLHDPDAWSRSLIGEDREQTLLAYRNFIEGISDYDVEYRIVRPDGSVRWIWDRAFPIRDETGKLCRVAGVALDVSQRRADQDRQRQLVEEVRHFAYIISHDLRAPLANLNGFSRELEGALAKIGSTATNAMPRLSSDERQQLRLALDDSSESLQYIRSSVSRMGRLIEAILKLSRLGHMDLRFQRLDMNELVQDTLNTLAHQINQKGVEVSIGDLPDIVADRTSMEQIVGNLLDNAIKYLDPARPARIQIAGWQDGSETCIAVTDDGVGIAADDRERVFQVFQRARNLEVPGEGMGLAYVRTLVRRHGGKIRCESIPGAGSTFTVTIPKNLRPEACADQDRAPYSYAASKGA
jgi:PAS domain S-box-containing protein